MSPRKLILGFLGRFLLAAALLFAPWPGWDAAYGRLLRATAQAVLGSFGSKGVVLFQPNDERDDALNDTKVFLGHRDQIGRGGNMPAATVKFSSRYVAYVPTALLVALVIASPVPWRRRLAALAGGLALAHAFVAGVLAVMIVRQYADSPDLLLFQFGPAERRVVKALYEVFVGYLGASYAVPVLLWIAVTFRREDWTRLFGQPGAPAAAPSTSSGQGPG
jgi:hypothetical protein